MDYISRKVKLFLARYGKRNYVLIGRKEYEKTTRRNMEYRRVLKTIRENSFTHNSDSWKALEAAALANEVLEA